MQTDPGHLNSDGTTLNMNKLIGFSISGTILGVQEVSDGTSETMIKGALSHFRILLSILLIILNNCSSYSSFGC